MLEGVNSVVSPACTGQNTEDNRAEWLDGRTDHYTERHFAWAVRSSSGSVWQSAKLNQWKSIRCASKTSVSRCSVTRMWAVGSYHWVLFEFYSRTYVIKAFIKMWASKPTFVTFKWFGVCFNFHPPQKDRKLHRTLCWPTFYSSPCNPDTAQTF